MLVCLMEGAGIGAERGTVWLSLTVALGIDFGSGGSEILVVSFLGVIGFCTTGAASTGFAATGATGRTGVAGFGGTVAGAGGIKAPGGFGAADIAAGGGGIGTPGRDGGTGMLDGGGGSGAPGGGGVNLPGSDGALGTAGGALKGVGAALGFGKLIGIVVRDDSSVAGLPPGMLMRMVSLEAPLCEGRLMRIVSFFTSPIRTVSFFTEAPDGGRTTRMVSFLLSEEDPPGFGGRVIRTVAFLEKCWSWGAVGEVGGVDSSAIFGSICIASAVRGVNLWL